jgi:hypothetical protein
MAASCDVSWRSRRRPAGEGGQAVRRRRARKNEPTGAEPSYSRGIRSQNDAVLTRGTSASTVPAELAQPLCHPSRPLHFQLTGYPQFEWPCTSRRSSPTVARPARR